MKPRVGELVAIAWTDAASNDTWSSADNMPTVIDCLTVGFIVSSSRRQVRVASSYARDARLKYGERVAIPRGCIVRIRKLKTGRLVR